MDKKMGQNVLLDERIRLNQRWSKGSIIIIVIEIAWHKFWCLDFT